MKVLILLFLSLLNVIAWFTPNWEIGDAFFYLPIVSIITSIIFTVPKIKNGIIQVRVIHFLLLGILFFNFPWYITSLVDFNSIFEILLKMNIQIDSFLKSCILLGVSIPLLVAGYLTCSGNNIKIQAENDMRINLLPLALASLAMMGLSISMSGLTVGSLYIGVSSYYYILLVRIIALYGCAFVFNQFNNYKRYARVNICTYLLDAKIYLMILLVFIAYLLIGGDRGPVLVAILIPVFGYLLCNKMSLRFKNAVLLLLFVLLFFYVFNVIEQFRISDGGADFSFDSLRTLDETEVTLGGAQRCTCLAIDGIDKGVYPHTYGLLTCASIIKSIPFVGKKFLDFINFPGILMEGSAQLITIQYYGLNPTSGLGTTYLADMYIEFGIWGVVIISFIYGIMIKFIDLLCLRNKTFGFYLFTFICFFVAYSIYTGRATLFTFLINYFHAILIFAFLNFLLSIFNVKLIKRKHSN